jgi:hypothetical protein
MNAVGNITATIMAFATYKPKAGQETELMSLVGRHVRTLRKLGFVTEAHNFTASSADGTIIEVFEWASADAVIAAHKNPDVGDLWNEMSHVAEFIPMKNLPESSQPFPGFKILTQH